jgi:hemerythrin superfamily protein
MTITIDIKNEKVEEFYRMLKEHDLAEESERYATLNEHIDEALRREQDPAQSIAHPWGEARQKYVGKGL